jgi:hypothetical protein
LLPLTAQVKSVCTHLQQNFAPTNEKTSKLAMKPFVLTLAFSTIVFHTLANAFGSRSRCGTEP